MKLIDYIEKHYGTHRGAKSSFLKDNPSVVPSQLSRWLRCNAIVGEDGRVYTSSSDLVLNLHPCFKTTDNV